MADRSRPEPSERELEAAEKLARDVAAHLELILGKLDHKLDMIAQDVQAMRARLEAAAGMSALRPPPARRPHGHAYPRSRSVPGCRTHHRR